ncbi:MAG: hypothetical protein HDS18_07825 [Bacteroides sp.]|nr:hypothetical protein [Bacteroides sp.]
MSSLRSRHNQSKKNCTFAPKEGKREKKEREKKCILFFVRKTELSARARSTNFPAQKIFQKKFQKNSEFFRFHISTPNHPIYWDFTLRIRIHAEVTTKKNSKKIAFFAEIFGGFRKRL